MTKRKPVYAIVCLPLFLLFAACVEVGDLETETRTIELGDAESAVLELNMGAGELNLHGGAQELVEATFNYNVERWKPRVDYDFFGKKGRIEIRQGKGKGVPVGSTHNKWDISVNKDIPIAIKIDFGAGEGDLDLRELLLESVDIDMGVGDLTVDITGRRQDDFRVDVDGGVGSATFYLPKHIGVRARVDKGIGSVNARGMQKEGNVYTNEAYGRSDITINMKISAGIGSIDLKVKNED
ncbi:MAG: hypothetical protein JXB23_01845 [Candidatus Aminicenantes bacterium]|nr:hypothetical protein [Candidatus Aminicenantes bacterium]